MVYIDRFPMSQEVDENGETLNWWDYLQRPEITEEDFEFVSRNASLSKSVVYVVMGNGNASYRRRSYDNAYLLITTGGLEGVMNIELENGRNFSEQEARGGANVAVLGHSVAQELFGNEDPVGKKVKIRGSRAIVVGREHGVYGRYRQCGHPAAAVRQDRAGLVLGLRYDAGRSV